MSILLPLEASIWINVLVNGAICGSIFVLLFSSGWFFNFLGPTQNSVSKMFASGGVIGAIHGLITAAVIYFYQPDSIGGCGFSTVIATEIAVFLASFGLAFWSFVKKRQFPIYKVKPFSMLVGFSYAAFLYSLFASVILFLPSLLLGVLMGKLQVFILQTLYSSP